MRDRYDEFKERGIDVVAIGMGIPGMAAHFRDEQKIPFPLLVDHNKQTYRALGIKRTGAWNVYGPPVWVKGIRSILAYGNKIPKQDPFQLGGVVVADKGGEVLFVHRATASSDNAPVDRILAAVA